MLGLKSKIILFSCLTSGYVNTIKCDLSLPQEVSSDEIETLLIEYFKSLGYEDQELSEKIKHDFGTDNQNFIDYVIKKVDHLKLICEVFKHYFTTEEILVLIKLNSLPEIKKINQLWPQLISTYEENLELRINAIKISLIALAKNQQG